MLKDDIGDKQIILIVMSKSDYLIKSSEVVKCVAENNSKICYVALNKPYNSIINSMTQNNIDSNKFYFIDVLTATVSTPPEVDNCTFVESPNAITDLSISFAQAMDEKLCVNSIFDAISSMIIHESEATVVKLTQNLMTRIRVNNKKSVFITLKEDSETLIKDLTLFVDAVIEL